MAAESAGTIKDQAPLALSSLFEPYGRVGTVTKVAEHLYPRIEGTLKRLPISSPCTSFRQVNPWLRLGLE